MNEQREAAWEAWSPRLTDRSKPAPSYLEAFKAAWDAAMATKAGPVTNDRVAAIEALIRYGIGSGMGYPYGAAAGAVDIVCTHLAAQPVMPEPNTIVTPSDLADAHARWHDQSGNLIYDGCEWERCEFWVIGKFLIDHGAQPVTGTPDVRLARSQGYKALAAERDFTGHTDSGRRTAYYEGFKTGQRFPEPVTGTVTDDMVERAARVMFEPPSVGVDGEYLGRDGARGPEQGGHLAWGCSCCIDCCSGWMSPIMSDWGDLVNIEVCIKMQADIVGVEHEGVPSEGVIVRMASAIKAARTERDAALAQVAERDAVIAAMRAIVFDPVSDYYGEIRVKFEALSTSPTVAMEAREAENS